MRPLRTFALTLLLAAPRLSAQVSTLDEGSFRLFRDGEQVGREQFSIRKKPVADGFALVATATITMGGRHIAPSLTTDTSGTPLSYDVEVRDGDRLEQRVQCTVTAGRFVERIETPSGTTNREMRLAPGTIVLDDDVVHHFFFVARAAARATAGRALPLIVPRREARDSVRIRAGASGPVEVGNGNATVTARHLTVADGGILAELWVDAAGRILRLEIPSKRFVATREEAPR